MKFTYEVKTNLFGENYLEMTTPEGLLSFVPMVAGNSDYQRYLRWLENPDAEEITPTIEGIN